MSLKIETEAKLLAKHSTIFGAGNFLNKIVAFALIPIYTRYLTPDEYGIKALVGLTVDVIGILLAIAISSAVYRFYFENEDIDDRNQVISSAIIAIGCIGILALIPLVLTAKTMALYILDSSDYYYFFLVAFASMWFQSLNGIGYNYLRAKQQSLKFVVLSFAKLIFGILLNIYFVCILKIGVLGVLIATLITSIMMFGVLVVPLVFKIGLKFSADTLRKMAKFGFPILLSQLGAFVVHLSDRFFIKALWSVQDAGLYSLSYRFGTLPGTFIAEPFNKAWQPRRYEMSKQQDSERIFGNIFTYFLFLMIFAGLAVSVLIRDLLMIVADSAFWSAYKVVPILILANIIFNSNTHFGMGLLITKKTKYLAYINLSNAIIVIFLNFILISRYGAYGAAYATLIAFVYKSSLTYYFSSRFYKIHTEITRVIKLIVSAGILFFAAYFVDIRPIYLSFLCKTIIVLFFPIVLYFFHFFKPHCRSLKLILRNKSIFFCFTSCFYWNFFPFGCWRRIASNIFLRFFHFLGNRIEFFYIITRNLRKIINCRVYSLAYNKLW